MISEKSILPKTHSMMRKKEAHKEEEEGKKWIVNGGTKWKRGGRSEEHPLQHRIFYFSFFFGAFCVYRKFLYVASKEATTKSIYTSKGDGGEAA